MKVSVYKITLDILESQSQYSLPMKKGETSREIHITLREGATPYELGEDCFAVFSGKKSDGKPLENNCVIKGDTIIYAITEQTTSASGLVDCEIKLYGADEGLICSARFSIIVDERVADDKVAESTPEFSALTALYSNVVTSENARVEAEKARESAEVEREDRLNEALQNFLECGKNLYDDTLFTVDMRADGTTKSGETCSCWIGVLEGESYVLSRNTTAVAYFRIYGQNVEGTLAQIYAGNVTKDGYVFTIPSGITHIRFSCTNANFVSIQLEKGTVKTEYEPYKEYLNEDLLKPISLDKTNFGYSISGSNNLIDDKNSVKGYCIDESGELSVYAKANTSQFIPVRYGDVISASRASGNSVMLSNIATYDDSFKVVRVVLAPVPNPFYINKNERFVRIAYGADSVNLMVNYGETALPYEEFVEKAVVSPQALPIRYPKDFDYAINQWFGKRLVVDGDSITHDQSQYNYWQFIGAKLLDMYLDTSDTTSTYASGWKGVGGSRIANELGANDKSQSIVLRYMDLPNDADLVMIACGTNDWAHGNVELGDFDSTDNTTFNGALNILCAGLKEKYPNIPVVLMTPIKRGTYGQTNSKGLTQEQFVDAMIKKCRQYNIYCLDMWANCPINPNITSMANTLYNANVDLVHPNAEGHKVMGKTVAGFIRTLS